METLSRPSLERIYYLTYMYGWIIAEERKVNPRATGPLEDKAYLYKHKIASELGPLLEDAMQTVIVVYGAWLSSHGAYDPEWDNGKGIGKVYYRGYTSVEYAYNSLKDRLHGLRTSVPPCDPTRDVSEHLHDRLIAMHNRNLQWLKNKTRNLENDYSETLATKYYSSYGPAGVQDHVLNPDEVWYDLGTADNIERFMQFARLQELDRIEHTPVDDLMDQGTAFIDMSDMWAVATAVLTEAGMVRTVHKVSNALFDVDKNINGTVSEKIIAFQHALTTAHNTGPMAAYLLGMENEQERAKEILDYLSSDAKTEKWHRELEKILGYDPAKDVSFSTRQNSLIEEDDEMNRFDRAMDAVRRQAALDRVSAAIKGHNRVAETAEDLLSKSVDGWAVSLITVLPDHVKNELREGKDSAEAIKYLHKVLSLLDVASGDVDKYVDAVMKQLIPE